EKGIGLLIKACDTLTKEEKLQIKTIHIVGNGRAISEYKMAASKTGLNIEFHGFLSRTAVHEIYKKSHAIILPSASEGFPKVIAEAMNYGCLPIVSNISSLSHYIKNEHNGFLFYPITEDEIVKSVRKLLTLTPSQYSNMIQREQEKLSKFTYAYYNNRIVNELAN
ncbi:glycosyltransferase, partial [Oceanihabitans sp.]|nr:glycosyltransferase [Oceanihabitans sp.]